MKFILARKIEMSQIFDDKGKVHPVTWLEAGPVFVTQKKSKEKDGYAAAQVGFGKIKKEFRSRDGKELQVNVGDKIEAVAFKEGDAVNVSGTSKGKGFQGVVKRHGFAGGPRTHGQKHSEREAGSIGATWPQRVLKGMRMPGHMGSDRVTVRNLKVIKIIPEKNLMAVSGAIPGHRGSLVEVRG